MEEKGNRCQYQPCVASEAFHPAKMEACLASSCLGSLFTLRFRSLRTWAVLPLEVEVAMSQQRAMKRNRSMAITAILGERLHILVV